MVFTSIVIHGITVPMSKLMMHGVTLTRSLPRSDSLIRRGPKLPVTVDDIRRIGMPTPVPWYSGSTSGRFDNNEGSSSQRLTPELQVESQAGTYCN